MILNSSPSTMISKEEYISASRDSSARRGKRVNDSHFIFKNVLRCLSSIVHSFEVSLCHATVSLWQSAAVSWQSLYDGEKGMCICMEDSVALIMSAVIKASKFPW